MNINLYSLLAQLIPGFILCLTYMKVLQIQWNKDYEMYVAAVAFLVGYFIDAISSKLEDFYFQSWGGKPSTQLLKGESKSKVSFYHHLEVKDKLKALTQNDNPNEDELFGIAMRYANGAKDTRVETFSASYGFSRNILTTCIFIFTLLCFEQVKNYNLIFFSIIGVIIAWVRCKERAYYYAKEILETFLKLHKEKEDKSV